MKIAVDWDDTLVDVHTQDWLPGALEGLRRRIFLGHDVFIHSSRANWPEGHTQIADKLKSVGLSLRIEPKVLADSYIDDRAEKPEWASDFEVPERPRMVHLGSVTRLPRRVDGIVVY